MTDEEAQELGRRSIVAAGHRDAYSGNSVNLFHVRENGWEFISELFYKPERTELMEDNYDLSELWYSYEEMKKAAREAGSATAGQGEAMAVEA